MGPLPGLGRGRGRIGKDVSDSVGCFGDVPAGKTGLLKPPDLQLAINWREQRMPGLAWAERYNPAFERAMVYLRTSEKKYIEEETNKQRLQKEGAKDQIHSVRFGPDSTYRNWIYVTYSYAS